MFNWSEVFTSIEGEGPYSGNPTTYIRFTKCNFKCQGFNNPNNIELTNEVLGFDPADYDDIYSIPLITKGCDSLYSWDKRFSHMWHEGDVSTLANIAKKACPKNSWIHPDSKQPVILSLTGGEPTLRAKSIPALLMHPMFDDLGHLLIETNCAVPLPQEFIDQMNIWVNDKCNRWITWSNSPKLSISGEPRDKAIRPDIALSQLKIDNSSHYFKFVCEGTTASFDEVNEVMAMYKEVLDRFPEVYIMPMACTSDQQNSIAKDVAELCIEYGFIYCHRIQNSVFGNEVGT